ncbi:hypothetical protein FRB97_005037 [Tulasnella sp. 331]|nr:hypothetical protein FRB97_005037 [Tulasnella sp. 331]
MTVGLEPLAEAETSCSTPIVGHCEDFNVIAAVVRVPRPKFIDRPPDLKYGNKLVWMDYQNSSVEVRASHPTYASRTSGAIVRPSYLKANVKVIWMDGNKSPEEVRAAHPTYAFCTRETMVRPSCLKANVKVVWMDRDKSPEEVRAANPKYLFRTASQTISMEVDSGDGERDLALLAKLDSLNLTS